MSSKGSLSRSSKRRVFSGASKTKATRASFSTTLLRAKYAGKRMMVTFRELAKAYPDRSVSVTVLKDVQSKAIRSQNALLIDVDPTTVEAVAESAFQQEQLLGTADMLDLEDVIDIANAAGRSSIHAMEGSNRLFGVLPPGRLRGKRYPRWQFSAGVAGDPLRRILSKLDSVDAWAKYQFFSSIHPDIGNLTPIEVLTGEVKQSTPVTDEAKALLNSPHDKRVRLLEELAEGFAHSP
jgi:hypothetical protein